MSTSCILYACYYKARGYCCTHIIKNQRKDMQKFIRIALPCVCFAVIIWWCYFNGFQYIHWKWLILAAGIGAVCYIGTINRYIYGRMCIVFGKKHSIFIRGYWHRFFATNLIVYCAPILTSALFSWILFAITKRQIKLKDDIS